MVHPVGSGMAATQFESVLVCVFFACSQAAGLTRLSLQDIQRFGLMQMIEEWLPSICLLLDMCTHKAKGEQQAVLAIILTGPRGDNHAAGFKIQPQPIYLFQTLMCR